MANYIENDDKLPSEYAIKTVFKKIPEWQKSPLLFIKDLWGQVPQPFLNEEKEEIAKTINHKEWTADLFWYSKNFIDEDWYEDIEWIFPNWKKWLYISWQQAIILIEIESIIKNFIEKKWISTIPTRLAIASWKWIWKTRLNSYLILWFLLCFPDALVPCTAPVIDQLEWALWKELAKAIWSMSWWMGKFFHCWKEKIYVYDFKTKKLSKDSFARARTASPNRPEALAWLHSDYMMYLVDEASAVDDRVYNALEWVATSSWWFLLVILISNPTRGEWYFYDCHFWSLRKMYTQFTFSGEETPLTNKEQNWTRKIEFRKAGWDKNNTLYRQNILGLFPNIWEMDDKWWLPIISLDKLNFIKEDIWNESWWDNIVMWIDPAWAWKNKSVIVIRDNFKAKVIFEEAISEAKPLAEKIILLMNVYWVPQENVYIDAFWVWSKVIKELALAWKNINDVYTSEEAKDGNTYINKRSEIYWRTADWLSNQWKLIDPDKKFVEIIKIKYKFSWKKIKIMKKEEMKQRWMKSPDYADALTLTFTKYNPIITKKEILRRADEKVYDNSRNELKLRRMWSNWLPKVNNWLFSTFFKN